MKTLYVDRRCVVCGKSFRARNPIQIYCSAECGNHISYNQWLSDDNKSRPKNSLIGTINELRVALDLSFKGYEIYRSLCLNSSCDLVALYNHKAIRVEVTTARYLANGKLFHAPHNANNYDVLALALPDKLLYIPELSTLKL